MHLSTRTNRLALTAAAPLMALAFVGSAQAAGGCTGAPGASAIQQYCEAVPEADGGSQRPGGGDASSDGGSGVSSKTASTLKQSGADGAAVANLAAGTPSSSSATGTKSKKKSDDSGAATGGSGGSGSGGSGSGSDGAVKDLKINGPSDPSGSPLKAATNAVGNGSTVGTGVVWGIVGLTAAGAAGAVFIRRRGNGFEPPADQS